MLQQIIVTSITVSLVILVFCLGLRATLEDVLYLLRRPGLLIRSLVSMNLVMPVFAVAVALIFPISHEVKIALIAISLSPIPPVLPGKQARAGGSASYAVSLLVFASVCSFIVVPVALELMNLIFGEDYQIPIAGVVRTIAITVLVPVLLGLIVRHLWPSLAERIARPASLLAAVVLLAAVLPVFVVSWGAFWSQVGEGVVIVLILFTVIGIWVGHSLGGPERRHRIDLALATGTRHPGVAIAIATLNFPDQRAALAVILWHLVIAVIVSLPYIRWLKRSEK